MRGLMSGDRDSKKWRLHIVLSLDNPKQRETWNPLPAKEQDQRYLRGGLRLSQTKRPGGYPEKASPGRTEKRGDSTDGRSSGGTGYYCGHRCLGFPSGNTERRIALSGPMCTDTHRAVFFGKAVCKLIHTTRAPHCLANYLDNAEARQYNVGYQKQEESQNECEIFL